MKVVLSRLRGGNVVASMKRGCESSAEGWTTKSPGILPVGDSARGACKDQRHKDLESLTIRITAEDMDQLKHLAEEYGVGHTTIAQIHRELNDLRPLANH